jgi:hypothetical protein
MSQLATDDRVSSGMNESPPEPDAPTTNPDAESSARIRELIDLLATAVVRVLGGEIPKTEGEPQS